MLLFFWLFWPYRLSVRTEPSQGSKRGSIPRRVTRLTNLLFDSILVLDKLEINKPVFTSREIAIEIEKMLSHELIEMAATITSASNKASKVSPDLESLNKEMT